MDFSGVVQTLFSKKTKQMDYTARLQQIEPNFNPDNFNTALPANRQIEFSNWKSVNAPNDSGYDYDLQGAFLAGVQRDTVTGHMPDTYKKPNHPTFSNQSQYAVGKWAKYAGTWKGEEYTPAKIWRGASNAKSNRFKN